MIFVDTGVWSARANSTDVNHAIATKLLLQASEPLFTTDYIIDEALTLLTIRRRRAVAVEMGEQFFSGRAGQIYHVGEEDVRNAWHVFRQFSDKGWSFTDCVSRVVMERFQIKVAMSFDHHFQQFGTVTVLQQ